MEIKPSKPYTLDINTKKKLAEKAAQLRELWEHEKRAKTPVYSEKLKRHVRPDPKWGFIRRTVDETFPRIKTGKLESFPSSMLIWSRYFYYFFVIFPCNTFI